MITTKSIEVIRELVDRMDDARFKAVMKAESDYWELDRKVSRNGYKRLVYHLRKVGLTAEEWFIWCDD